MSRTLTTQGRERVAEIAGRYGVSVDAALTLLSALQQSGGRMAQFNIPELGGGGQWMQGGMTMVGDMFNHGLKAKVDGLCLELSALLPDSPQFQSGNFQMQSQGAAPPISSGSIFTADVATDGEGWPQFGAPAWRGAQNDMRYAYYPAARRLVISIGGTATIYDTGDHQLLGVSQQQQNGGATLAFTSQYGVVTLGSLRPVTSPEPAPAPASQPPADGAMPEAQELADTRWTWADATVTLLADGSVSGGERRTSAYWALEQGVLRLFAEDGSVSAKFDAAQRDDAGRLASLFLAADPRQSLTRPAATQAQPATATPHQGVLELRIDLTERAWELLGPGNAVLARLRLLADGRIEGGRVREARWRADAASLTLLHGSGRPTARLDGFNYRNGLWSLDGVLLGEENSECILKQV